MPILPLAGTAAPRGALVPIASLVITNTSTQQFDFVNIPQIYQDLRLVVSMRNTGNNLAEGCLVYLNVNTFGFGDNTYSQTNLISNPLTTGATGAVTSTRDTNPQRVYAWGASVGALASPNIFGNSIFDFLSYAGTTGFKQTIVQTFADTNGANSMYMSANNWRRTVAINQISIFSESGGSVFLVPGSTATLYGVRSVNQ